MAAQSDGLGESHVGRGDVPKWKRLVVGFVWCEWLVVGCFSVVVVGVGCNTLRAVVCLWLFVVCSGFLCGLYVVRSGFVVVCTGFRLLVGAAEERGGCTRFSRAQDWCVTSSV